MCGGNSLVVFHDHGYGLFRRFLRRGFRHVFVAVRRKGYWIVLDGLSGLPVLDVAAGADDDLAGFYRREHGFTVVVLDAPRLCPRAPFMLATCVGSAKRLLGLRAPCVVTPYQLYRYLHRR